MSAHVIRCRARRKAKTCKNSKGVCMWDNNTHACDYIEHNTEDEKHTKVMCTLRKHNETCLKDPNVCSWITTDKKCVFTHKETPDYTQKAKRPKQKSIKEAITAENNDNNNSKPTASTLKFANELSRLHCRHCHLYANDANDLKLTRINHMEKECYRESYDPQFNSRTNMHFGQRKLLLSEILLLTEYYKQKRDNPTIVYVSSAPASHLVLLADLFPRVSFILYDGAKYDYKLKTSWLKNRFEVHGLFTTEKCTELATRLKSLGKPVLFVSDIRLGDIDRDMASQKEWVRIIDPDISLLNFRMPPSMKNGDKMKYLEGTLLYGIWAKPQSRETRLMVHKHNNNNFVSYDFKTYQETQFFHNKYRRAHCFKDALQKYGQYMHDRNLYCPCHDCFSELSILDAYTQLNPKYTHTNNLNNVINLMASMTIKKFWNDKSQPLRHADELYANVKDKYCKSS